MKTWILVLAFLLVALPAEATEQEPDRIVVNGSEVMNLLPYRFMLTPFVDAFGNEFFDKTKDILKPSMCTAVYRGYVAFWEVKDGTFYLTKVIRDPCRGQGEEVPLTTLFPDSTGPVPAIWYSGDLVVHAREREVIETKAEEVTRKFYDKFLIIHVQKGRAVSMEDLAQPDNYQPCDVPFCRGSDRIFFPPGEAILTTESQDVLAVWVIWLKRYREDRMVVEGHCDASEQSGDCVALGQQRANAARDFLIGQGISADRIGTASYGKSRPVALGSNAEALEQNRRAVATFTYAPR